LVFICYLFFDACYFSSCKSTFMQPFWAKCGDRRLAAVWRGGAPEKSMWVLCPPFAEEEKCARRTFTEIAAALQRAGHSSLIFTFSGTGDSEGDFAAASLDKWREEIVAVCALAVERAPHAKLNLCGLRLGASLAAQVADQCGTSRLWLLEPVLEGKAYLAQLGQRRRLRGMLTDAENNLPAASEDLDGWPLGQELKTQLEELQLGRLRLPEKTQIWQIGARREAAPALQHWAEINGTEAKVLLMPPFWNRLDAVSPEPLLDALELKRGSGVSPLSSERQDTVEFHPGETPFLIPGKSGALAAILHLSPDAKSTFILMLHGWSGYRTGPHQMQTRAARHFTRMGFPVLRFDFAGRGDSDGATELATLATMKDDVESALDWIKSTFPQHKIILSGLCSGCEVAFAAAAAPGINGLMLWSAPVFAAGASGERSRRKRWHHLGEYARKMLRVSTYKKLWRGELDARGVSKVLSHQGGESKNIENDLPGQLPLGWRQAVLERNKTLNLPVLMIFGGADPTVAEALAWYEKQLPRECRLEKTEIAGANHSYYGLAWEREVIERSGEWLQKYFCDLPTSDS
jgi:alpha/beta superfamily hydrolase